MLKTFFCVRYTNINSTLVKIFKKLANSGVIYVEKSFITLAPGGRSNETILA
jgi:hypothetical protein